MDEEIPLDDFSYQERQKELHKKLTLQYQRRYGPRYSMLFQKYWNDELLDLCPAVTKGTVVDFACGTGILFESLAKSYPSVVGFDLSFEMLRDASVKHSEIKAVLVGDGCHLPFLDASIPLVVCRSAIHHLPDLDQALKEIYRVLEPGGSFVFTEPTNDNVLIRVARFIFYKLSSRFDEDDLAFLTPELSERLLSAGYDVKAVKRFGYFSYLFSGFPDHFPIMNYLPFNVGLTRIFIWIDKYLSKIPIIKDQSFHVMFKTSKPSSFK